VCMAPEALEQIAAQATFLDERPQPHLLPCEPEDSALIDTRFERWRTQSASGDSVRFNRRLEWDGLDERSARARLTPVRWRKGTPLPDWTVPLGEYLRRSKNSDDEMLPVVRAGEPVVFEEILLPLVQVASDRLREQAGCCSGLLSTQALCDLRRQLLILVCSISAETLYREFTVWRATRPGRGSYAAFVRHLLHGGLTTLFAEYPVLARLLATCADQWVASTREFLARLKVDLPDIGSEFCGSQLPGAVTKIESGLSDRHAGGRSTHRLTFESGLSLYYKPKDIDAELAYWDVLRWLNTQAIEPQFQIFQVLSRAGYGWAQEVPHEACSSEAEVQRYYIRAGMLLCLFYALEATDCHYENIIASGEHPVLIDMETLLQHRAGLDGDGEASANSAANRMFYWDSVFRTAFLPRWTVGVSGQSYDISGIGGATGETMTFRRKTWQFPNSDLMILREEVARQPPHRNRALIAEMPVAPEHYVENIVDGFSRLYRFLSEHEQQLLGPAGPFTRMSALRLRFIFRHTSIYQTVMNGLLKPQALKDGVEASLQTEILCRGLLYSDQKPLAWPVLAYERRALLNLDIPVFRSDANSRILTPLEGPPVPECFEEPSFDLVRAGFRRRNADDLQRQIGFIRSSFPPKPRVKLSAPVPADDNDGPLPREELIGEAVAIAEQIAKTAICSSDGTATWISVGYVADAQRWQLQPMRPRLYDGVGGVAVFLAALESVTGRAEFGALARAALRTATESLSEFQFQRALFEPGIGAGTGAASLIYSLLACARFLKDDNLKHQARQIADWIDAARIDADNRFDLMSGAAGAILALLALDDLSPSSPLLDKAILCGRRLIEGRVLAAGEHRAWPNLDGNCLTGFSHGAAGIAYALLRLYRATGDPSFRDAAAEAYQYETAVFLPQVKNWPDFRYHTGQNSSLQSSWCHGAAGIGLARAAGLSELDDDSVREDIANAIETTVPSSVPDLDHLCCGHLGRTELFLMAARVLGVPEYEERARSLAGFVVRRAKASGNYLLGFDSCPNIPSLHQGMAGIGYQLLRIAEPSTIPSLLLWE
jgi:type 2 lantibiotic biosynthesis protein LanM